MSVPTLAATGSLNSSQDEANNEPNHEDPDRRSCIVLRHVNGLAVHSRDVVRDAGGGFSESGQKLNLTVFIFLKKTHCENI
jgi:hypothetical protein